ncbi:hypothetical protein ABG067_009505, partial [Albugo candida]
MVWVYTGVAIGAVVFGVLYYWMFRHYDVMDEETRLKKIVDYDTQVGYGVNDEKN